MVPSAYVHIPFCDSICAYCDFVRMQKNELFFSSWKEQLIQEIQEHKISSLHTLYFGGGTPSLLSVDDFASIRNCFPKDIEELSEIVKMGIVFENNEYALISESAFHTKLYKITGNKIISEFQEIIHPILVYVKEKFKDYLKPINIEMSKSGRIATHADLLDFIKKGDEKGYRDAIERHFEVYKIFKVNRSQELMAEKAESEKVEGI